jgi:hypothetical protein
MPTIKKNIDLNPITANILELKTINGSAVIAKIAGILSIAKKMSVNSMIISATKSGVANLIPSFLMKNLSL